MTVDPVFGYGASVSEKPAEKRGIQSIGVGLRLLDVLRLSEASLSLAAISRASGVPVSSCHRYLASFIRHDYVAQDPNSGHYRLGGGIVQAGLAALRRTTPVIVGLGICDLLAERTGRTAQLSIWSEVGPVVVGWRVGRVPLVTNLSIGSRLPIARTSTGLAFVAHLPETKWAHLTQIEGDSPEHMRDLIADVRRRGHAEADGTLNPGLHAVAAALRDTRGEAKAAVALLGITGEIGESDIQALIGEVGRGSAALGFTDVQM